MARRDADHTTRTPVRGPRRGPGRLAILLPVLLVLALLGTAVAADEYAWGPTYLGWKGGDPATDPGVVAPPALLDLPAVGDPEPVAEPVTGGGLAQAKVLAALSRALRTKGLGPHVVAAVAPVDGGDPVLSRGKGAFLPASTTKLLTGVAALSALEPGTTFDTTVVAGARKGDIILVGGGDPFLATRPDPAAWPVRADLTTLAAQTAEALRAQGTETVRLRYDTSLFAGPAINRGWESDYVPDGVVSPITSLWADEGRDPQGWGRVEDPARSAAASFAVALRGVGIKVSGLRPARAALGAEPLAAVTSPPLDQIVQRVIDVSDNEAAEVLMRHVGRVVEGEASNEAGVRAVRSVLAGLGVEVDDLELHDGSGLSRSNRVRADTLVDVLQVASSPEHPELRALVEGLPVAGFTGSLRSRFAEQGRQGLGRVRAKTGTLTGAHSLAGLVTGADGVPMVFVVAADKVAPDKSLEARAALDAAAAALASCRCGEVVGSVG